MKSATLSVIITIARDDETVNFKILYDADLLVEP